MIEQKDKELCRLEALKFLDERAALKHEAGAVARGMRRAGYEFDTETIEAALSFLASAGFVSITPCALGASKFYQITADGVLARERGY